MARLNVKAVPGSSRVLSIAEQLQRVSHGDRRAETAQMQMHLCQATDITTGHHIRARGHHRPGLLLAKRGGDLRL